MDAIECLKTRRSVRDYENRLVPREIIEQIVDCGRLAATAINIQPWKFVAVQDPAMLKKLADAADYGKFIAKAPLCIVVLCEDVKYFLEDGSAAVQNILNAARALGLGSCWVAGDKKEYARAVADMLGAPSNYRLVALVPMGYSNQYPSPAKKPLSEVLSWEKF